MHDMRLKFPFTWLVCGGSGCGKTTHILNFLSNKLKLIDSSTDPMIVYYYNQWQPAFSEFEKRSIVNSWVSGAPSLSDITERITPYISRGSIVVIDDFAHKLTSDIIELFTVVSHHSNCGVILLSQNLFDKNPIFRQLSLNSTYISVFKNPRDAQQISAFARQLRPQNFKFIVDSYHEATKKPYTYLFFDNHQRTFDMLRIRSNILPHESPMTVWIPKNRL